MCCYLSILTTDVAKFLSVTLKRVSLPPGASTQRHSLMKKLDELQQSYPQLYWELEDDDSCDQTGLGSGEPTKYTWPTHTTAKWGHFAIGNFVSKA